MGDKTIPSSLTQVGAATPHQACTQYMLADGQRCKAARGLWSAAMKLDSNPKPRHYQEA